jgi:hypothetical protein
MSGNVTSFSFTSLPINCPLLIYLLLVVVAEAAAEVAVAAAHVTA